MALVVADRVWETTSTSGTGTLTLSGAVSGYQTFAAIGNGNTTYYTITNGTDWEVGIGTYTSSGTTLSRDTVLSSSLGGTTKITVTPGSFVFCDYPASKSVYEDESGNVTGYPISGGTINNTTIGATTPSTVNATTITGQTARVNGTGQNLLLQSGWAGGTSGTVGSGAVAPTSWTFGSTGGTVTYASALSGSGNSIRFAATGADRPFIQQAITLAAGLTYSARFRVEVVNSGSVPLSQLFITTGTGSNTITYFVDGVAATGSTIVSAGTNVQIVTIIGSIVASTFVRFGIGVNSAVAGDVTLANPQLEIGSVANTYIPTTTTAVYGTPTLSFSGVSEIGLLSTGALYLQPAGTGALQAQATTSSATGGNARGTNAVDWQTSRAAAAQVASGAFSVAGGASNTASGFNSIIAGGSSNSAGQFCFIGGGTNNTAQATQYGVVAGGQSNNSSGFHNFIGGGQSNTGTAAAAVTTQSGTMNGTTAVTLSGSNASIRVGQVIQGTSIANFTYVAAISGTSLTLSQNASGSSTSTLSFFTPHGVVVGGGNNQATGSYSFIGGGGDAGTAANRNVASGDWSAVGGGRGNTASGVGSFVGGGGLDGGSSALGNTASGTVSFVGGGLGSTASGLGSSILGGYQNIANGQMSSILGGRFGNTRSINGNFVFSINPISDISGLSQSSVLILGVQTTDATATALRSNSSAAGTTNQVILPNNSAYYFKGSCIANVTGAANGAAWSFEGAIMRGANAASTVLIDTPSVNRVAASSGATAWVLAITADTTNGGLRVTVTGVAATTIRWVAKVETTEVTF